MNGKRCVRTAAARAMVEGLERRVLLDGTLTYDSETDVAYDTARQWYWSDIVVSGAPAGATVTKVDYWWKVDANFVTDDSWQLKGPGFSGAVGTPLIHTGGDIFSGYAQTSEGGTTLTPPAGTAVNGTWSFGVYDNYDDWDEYLNSGRIDSWTMTIYYTQTAAPAEIQVTGNGYDIVNNDSTPATYDLTNFGTSYVGMLGAERSFIVKNLGTGPLNIGAVSVPAGFTITQSLMSVISPGSTAALGIRANTTAAGTYSGDVSIASNDSNENPFKFRITSTVATPAPEIEVRGNGYNIVHNDTTPSTTDGTSFGTTYVGLTAPERSFSVRNIGTGPLTIGATTVPSGFTIVQALPSVIDGGGSATLIIRMSTAALGTYSGDVTIVNNEVAGSDGIENPFTFRITGTVNQPVPEIHVTGFSTPIVSGDTTPSFGDSTDFGSVYDGQLVTRTYTVNNWGTATLTLGAVTVPAPFTIVQALPATLAPNASATLQIGINTRTLGTYGGTVSIVNDDADGGDGIESPFTFAITATVILGPDVSVSSGTEAIVSGQTAPIDFGSVSRWRDMPVRTFTVRNDGGQPLTRSSSIVNVPAGFEVIEPLATSIAPGASDTFTVRMLTGTAGTYSGQVIFTSNDPDESPFTFPISGNVDAVPANVTAEDYAAIRSRYGNFGLPVDPAGLNIVEITADVLNAVNLKAAIAEAGTTTQDDLVVLRTTSSQDRIRFTSSTDGIAVNVPSSKGTISIVGFGPKPVTIDAAGCSRVLTVGGSAATVKLNLGGVTLTGGSTSGYGGAMYQENGTTTLTHVVMTGNKANSGGGMYQFSGTSTLTNVIMEGNSSNYAGGLRLSSGTSTLNNVTIARNISVQGGGVEIQSAGALTLRNTIVAENSASQSGNDILVTSGSLSGSYNLIGDGSGQSSLTNGQNGNLVGSAAARLDPMLAEGDFGQGWLLMPIGGSPAIGTGDDAAVPAGIVEDVYGNARMAGAHVNMGAVESEMAPKPAVTYIVTSLDDSIAVDGVVTLREATQASARNLAVGDAEAGSYSATDLITFAPDLSGAIQTNGVPYRLAGSFALQGDGRITLDGQGLSRVLEVYGAYDVTISDLTISGGSVTGNAGGMDVLGANLVLSDVIFRGNAASMHGAGMSQAYGTVVIEGGGAYGNTGYSAISLDRGLGTVRNVTISGNEASGFRSNSILLLIENSTIADNRSRFNGGAIDAVGGSLSVVNSMLLRNSADTGGGAVYCQSVVAQMTNVVFSGNSAREGGAINFVWGSMALTNVTITGNAADYYSHGGGIYQNSNLTINNSIVAGNQGSDLYRVNDVTSGRNNLIGNGAGQTGLVNGVNGNIVGTSANPIDPMLAQGFQTATGMAPLAGSPVIDAGDSSLVPAGITTDLHGGERIQGTQVNIGAVETVVAPRAAVLYTVTSLADGVGADGQLTLREALEAANRNEAVGDAPAGSYSAQDRIFFAPGLSGAIPTNGTPYRITSDVEIAGSGADVIALDGGGLSGVIEISGGCSVRLSGLEIRNGVTLERGGGIRLRVASLILTDSRVVDNTAWFGGGIYQNFGSLSVKNAIIAGNTSTSGGGGFYQQYTSAEFVNVLIAGNKASSGGAMAVTYGYSYFYGCTIAGNSASGSAGGISRGNSYGASAMDNTILAGNTAPSYPDLYEIGDYVSGYNNLIGVGMGGALANGNNGNLAGTLASPLDARFVNISGTDWREWDLRLRADSPAVDTGSNTRIPAGVTTDITGGPRIENGTVDRGAYERDQTRPTVVSWNVNNGAAQRSMVKTAQVVFDEAVNLLDGAISVLTSRGAAVPGLAVSVANPLGDQKTWELTFNDDALIGESLPDGMYRLVVSGAKVADLAGNVMTGDYSQQFHRLFGDFDGDRDVDAVDLARFKKAMNRPSAYDEMFDYDGDDLVNGTDYRELKLRMRRLAL